MNLLNWVKRHSILVYFLLAFSISWGNVLLITGTGRFQGQAVDISNLVPMLLAMLTGPVTGGLLMTAITGGKLGLRDLLRRMARVRVSAASYAAAIFTNGLLTPAILLGMSVFVSPAYFPNFNPIGVLFGLAAGIFEEIGWTGFATPRLLEKHSVLGTGLRIGVLWGIWHLLAGFLGSLPGNEAWWAAEALVFWVGGLVAYRILMTMVYARTRSVLVGQIMHAFFTGIFFTFIPKLPVGQSSIFYMVETVGLWLIVAVMIARYGISLSAKPREAIAAPV